MRTRCLKREQIFALAEGMADERERSAMTAHVQSCADCRKTFEEYRRLDDVLEQWNPAADPSPWFDARLRAEAASRGSARSARGFFGLAFNRWLAVPILASLLVVAGLIAYRHALHRIPAHPAQVAAAHVPPAAEAVRRSAVAPQNGAQELSMYQNLSVLEDYDMLAGFDVISELPKGSSKVAD
jgi:anti-sigma factor RsiW